MRPLIHEITTRHTPESLVEQLHGEPGIVLLRSALFDSPQARYSFVAARPFLAFRSFGSRCEIETTDRLSGKRSAEFIPRVSGEAADTRNSLRASTQLQFGNP